MMLCRTGTAALAAVGQSELQIARRDYASTENIINGGIDYVNLYAKGK